MAVDTWDSTTRGGRRGPRLAPGPLAAVAVLALGGAAAGVPPGADEARTQGRRHFTEGAALVQQARWAEALAAFEQSAGLYSHPVTTYNMGACERALGRYTRARKALFASLAQHDEQGAALPAPLAEQARAYVAEIERSLVRAHVVVSPADATLAVDGRPLAEEDGGGQQLRVAGTAAAGPGAVPPPSFTLLLDPGTHLFTLARKGYSELFESRTVAPGSTPEIAFEMARLPARLAVTANLEGAVALDGLDVGVTPLTLERPAGKHHLVVRRAGFSPYETRVDIAPGERLDLDATLVKVRLVSRWWFWTAIGLPLAGGAATITYAATLQPAPYDCGALGWCIHGGR